MDARGVASLSGTRERRDAVRCADVDDWGEPEGVDIQNLHTPDVGDLDVQVALSDAAAPDTIPLVLDDPDEARQPLEYADGTLVLTIRPHDFRAIELAW